MEEIISVSHQDLVRFWIEAHYSNGYVVVVHMEYGNDNLMDVLEEHVDAYELINADICICDFKDDENAAFDFVDNVLDESTVGCYAALWENGVVVHENT